MAIPPHNLRYGALFGVLGASCVLLAALSSTLPLALVMGWSGMSFLVVSAAYLMQRPRLLGKQSDGGIALSRAVLLFPFFALAWGVWRMLRALAREDAYHEVAPGLWLGRRLGGGERLPPGITLVVDLTAELSEPPAIREVGAYLWVPAMDASVPEDAEFRAAVHRIAAERESVYVHCAAGHGRSAALVAAVLLSRGMAESVDTAERRLRARRAGVRLNASQRGIVARMAGNGGG